MILPEPFREGDIDWQRALSHLDDHGFAVIPAILTDKTCKEIVAAYADDQKFNEQHIPRKREKTNPSRTARSGFVTKIALLRMVDNLGAGLVGPLISYWFFRRFGVQLKSLGFMFFLSYFFAALSFLAAPVLARYMGVVKTMAFTHGLASMIYLFLPLAPSFSIAAAMTVVRSFLAYMDNPLRSSFIMGIVRPEDRGSAAGITTLSRHVPVALSPTLSAYLMQSFSLNVPIFIGGFLQLLHDCVFYLLFRNVKPPEEEAARG